MTISKSSLGAPGLENKRLIQVLSEGGPLVRWRGGQAADAAKRVNRRGRHLVEGAGLGSGSNQNACTFPGSPWKFLGVSWHLDWPRPPEHVRSGQPSLGGGGFERNKGHVVKLGVF